MSELRNFLNGITELANQFTKWAATIDWEAVHQKMQYMMNKLPSDLEDVSISLMNRGWFIWFLDGSMDDFSVKINNLINKDKEEQDRYMEEYIKTEIYNLKQSLLENHPNRKGQIEAAFEAHEQKLYYCSVPTLLAISEGIGRDLYPGIGLYSKKDGRPKTGDLFGSVSGLEVFEESVLKPLKVSSEVTCTISAPTNDEKRFLNRHLIMHGLSEQYGNELNSLKAISLAYFVHKSLSHLKSA